MEILKQLINNAVLAPSGENCQPWKFVIVGEDTIEMYNIPERDYSLYSSGQRASIVAHGAAYENMSITAAELGYELRAEFFPDSSDPNFIARIKVSKSQPQHQTLFVFLSKRCSNRKPYESTAIPEEIKNKILNVSKELNTSARVSIVDEQTDIKKLGIAAGINEEILFEDEKMHKFFYDHITWTEKENVEKSIGFYIKSLEVLGTDIWGFKMFSKWNLLKILNRIGASKFVAKNNSKTYRAAGAYAAIIVPTTSAQDYFDAGRVLERVWLELTKSGMSMQLMTGIVFLHLKLKMANDYKFQPKHVKLIEETYGLIADKFKAAPNETVALMFRIGKATEPTARSTRLAPIIESK